MTAWVHDRTVYYWILCPLTEANKIFADCQTQTGQKCSSDEAPSQFPPIARMQQSIPQKCLCVRLVLCTSAPRDSPGSVVRSLPSSLRLSSAKRTGCSESEIRKSTRPRQMIKTHVQVQRWRKRRCYGSRSWVIVRSSTMVAIDQNRRQNVKQGKQAAPWIHSWTRLAGGCRISPRSTD